MADTGNIHLTIVDGARQPIAPDIPVLVRILNGEVNIPAKWAAGSDIEISDIEFTDTDNDTYNVFAHAQGFDETVSPNRVQLLPGRTAEVALLATPNHGQFHFQSWETFKTVDPRILKLVTMAPPIRHSVTPTPARTVPCNSARSLISPLPSAIFRWKTQRPVL